ncbi:hypothetical protein [Solirubrobacter soli]|nr:hypothetical protein [Solirubrobacter soli]
MRPGRRWSDAFRDSVAVVEVAADDPAAATLGYGNVIARGA